MQLTGTTHDLHIQHVSDFVIARPKAVATQEVGEANQSDAEWMLPGLPRRALRSSQ
jgi:hypothetical protein